MAKKSKKRGKQRAQKRKPHQTGRAAEKRLELLSGDHSCVLTSDELLNTLFISDKCAVEWPAFERGLVDHIKQFGAVQVIVSKDDIESCNVQIAERVVNALGVARQKGLLLPRQGAVSILPYGTGYSDKNGFDAYCRAWCEEFTRRVPVWWYFIQRKHNAASVPWESGKPCASYHDTCAYWLVVSASKKVAGESISKASAMNLVLDSVESSPKASRRDEDDAVRWMKRSGLLLSFCKSKKELDTFRDLSKRGVKFSLRS